MSQIWVDGVMSVEIISPGVFFFLAVCSCAATDAHGRLFIVKLTNVVKSKGGGIHCVKEHPFESRFLFDLLVL